MKQLLQFRSVIALLLLAPLCHYGQAPSLGTAANYALFSNVGAVTNTGSSHITGSVGTNSGSISGFGNVDGILQQANGFSAQSATDVNAAFSQLNNAVPTYFPSVLMGNGQVFIPGVYSIAGAATLNANLTLDAQNDPNAIFIIQIEGAFATSADAQVLLIRGAQACNVFWKTEGLISLGAGTSMKGTLIAHNAAITMSSGVMLEGSAFSTAGAISVDGILSYIPMGCGRIVPLGPTAPNLKSTICYALFSGNGPVTNDGETVITGDIGTNVGSSTGFAPLNVTGQIHATPDASTATATTDLIGVYNYLNALSYDIELMHPAQFGNDLVLTPHTYLLNAATALTNNVYLNAQNNTDAVFVFQINGALSTSTFAHVILINGAQAKNVFWKVDGAVSINNFSQFVGTIICNNGAISLLTGVQLTGRALTTTGALSTSAVSVMLTPGCGTAAPMALDQTKCQGATVAQLSATGTDIQWYTSAVGGTPLATSALLSTGTYYATQTINGTESGRTMVSVTITPLPVFGGGTYYVSGTKQIQNEFGYNSIYTVYANLIDVAPLPLTTVLTNGTYYATITQNGCVSLRAAVNILTYSVPAVGSSTCGTTLSSISNTISVPVVAHATGYLFEVTANGVTRNYYSTTNSFNLTQLPGGIAYHTSYSIRVAAGFNGQYGDFGTACVVNSPVLANTTQINASMCGTSLASMNTALYSGQIVGATAYRFKVTSGGVTRFVESNSSNFQLSSVSGGVAYGTAYDISVAALINGTWQNYGTVCSVTTPSAITQVVSSQCGTTLAGRWTSLNAAVITGATSYLFEWSNGGAPVVFSSATSSMQLGNYNGWTVSTTYSVRVAAQLNGTWQAFGAACNVTTPAVSTQVRANQCGTVLANKWSPVYCGSVTGATGYRFEWVNGATTLTYTSSISNMQLGNYTGWAINTAYTVRVAIQFGGAWQAYGNSCIITSPASLARNMANNEADLTIKAIPNPFETDFVLMAQGGNQLPFEVGVYNMLGQQMDQFTVAANALENQSFGSAYTSGIYNVIIKQGENQQMVRMIKK